MKGVVTMGAVEQSVKGSDGDTEGIGGVLCGLLYRLLGRWLGRWLGRVL